ncbi:LysM peptidoglycan-binding domain-containing protein [Neobacillus dielmonensis]|uniref:LysM peptidoglycan-binding domain-containing protein n=1 Tax=Neobacillus dielmonensis TaxID=1347369 RepID=UPI0005A9B5DB|nr:LysM peptidoglycan-binding domain-containing protein [Neobacillus dielmonensis]
MTVHVVGAGDSLWSISNTYGVPLQTIMSTNGLPSEKSLVPGLALYLPDHTTFMRSYKIKAGDNDWSLAKVFQTTPEAILSANPGINTNLLSIGQVINIPSPLKLRLATLGFLIPYDASAILPTLGAISKELTFLAIVAYSFTSEGYAYNEIEDSSIVARCKELNITPLLMIRNFAGGNFSPNLAGDVLGNSRYRNNLIASIVNLARQRGFGGISIDFEFIPPARRNDFSSFLSGLKSALGNLILQVNVHAKTEDIPTNRIIGAYDYAAIGRAADLVAVMTIDYGYPGGPPDPIAPIPWMEQVIQYSLTQIPSSKLQVAIALYGYDKVTTTKATTAFSILAAQNLAISTGTSIQYDASNKSPWFRYWRGAEEHIVRFEDIRSLLEKYRLMDIYQLSGTTFWQISLPAPQNWAFIRDHIEVFKLYR